MSSHSLMTVNFTCRIVTVFLLIVLGCGPIPKKDHSQVSSVFFASPDTVGILVTHYRGGDGTSFSGDEHAEDYHLHYYLYCISTANVVETPATFDISDPGADLLFAESLFVLRRYYNGTMPYYSPFKGTVRGTISASPDHLSPELKSVSPNGRFIYFYSFNSEGKSQVYDLFSSTFTPVFTLPTYLLIRIENDGERYLTIDEENGKSFLVRRRFDNQDADSLADVTGYSLFYFSQPRWVLFYDQSSNVFMANTDTDSLHPLQALPILGQIVDLDTSTGYYLSHTPNDLGAYLGNYKTGMTRLKIYSDF